MVEELRNAADEYFAKWATFAKERTDTAFFEGLRPTAIAWKTTNLADFNTRFAELRDVSDQAHLGWVNERWLATFRLKDVSLPQGIKVVKLMQRRPGSTDAAGLDHVDFYLPAGADAKAVVSADLGVKWTEEKNGDHCKWLSVWFAGTEAKLRSDTVLAVCIQELEDAEKEILA